MLTVRVNEAQEQSYGTSLSLSSASCSLRCLSMDMSHTPRHLSNSLATRGFLNSGSCAFFGSGLLKYRH